MSNAVGYIAQVLVFLILVAALLVSCDASGARVERMWNKAFTEAKP